MTDVSDDFRIFRNIPPLRRLSVAEATTREAASVTDVSDDDLVLLYRDGDAEAFDTLFDRYYAPVYHFARMMLSDAGAAEDVLQETFLAVARTARRYEPQGRFRTWLMRIVRNRCLNRLEADRNRRQVIGDFGLDVDDGVSRGPSPGDRAEANEQMRVVRRAIAELPDRQREALVLYAFEQMAYHEIAGVLGLPLNTVKTLIHRARAAVARTIEGPENDVRRGI